MKLRVCDRAGCFRMVQPPARYCTAHQAEQQEYDKAKAARAESDRQRWSRGTVWKYQWVYQDKRWRKLRAEQLIREPCCRMCGAPGQHVDHIVPHQGNEALAFDPCNLQTLCRLCHDKKTRQARRDAVNR